MVTIKLKTKTTNKSEKSLSSVSLAQGEPLVNVEDKTLIIATSDAKYADDASTIVLGKSEDSIGNNTSTSTTEDAGIYIKHRDGNEERYTNVVKGTSAKVSYTDPTDNTPGEINIDSTYTLGAQPSATGTTLTLKDCLDAEHSDVILSTKNIVGASSTATANAAVSGNTGVYLNHLENGYIQSSHKISSTNGINITSDSNGNITIQHDKEGPASSYSKTESTASTISGSGGSGIINLPNITVDTYGHVTAASDESVAITLPTISDSLTSSSSTTVASSKAVTTLNDNKAPNNHASDKTTYGVASGTDYGHAKASTTTPKSNGTATVGNETSSFARGDHVHPTDTTRASKPAQATGSYDRPIILGGNSSNTSWAVDTLYYANAPDSAIKITANPSSGQIKATSFNATSDARLKENFQPLISEKSILDLPTYKFDFIGGVKGQIGCKAQDLQEICPEIVNEGDDGYLSIQESKIVYLLLDEVKKLRKELNELKGV